VTDPNHWSHWTRGPKRGTVEWYNTDGDYWPFSSPAEFQELGEDRWLPDRMASLGFLIQGEKKIFEDYLRMVDLFFGAIRGDVLKVAMRIVDPFGVFSALLRFNRWVTDFLTGGVTWVLRQAYQRVLGDFDFSARPYVAQHLELVRNRMVRLPDEVFDLIRVELDQGIHDGEGIPELADRIDQTLLNANAERWRNRAVVVARTESLSAYNGGSFDAFGVMQQELGMPLEKVWLATMDPRTRDTHFVADGQRAPLLGAFTVGGSSGLFPGDPALPASERIQCRCTMLVVEPGENVDMAGRGWKAAAETTAEVDRRARRGIIRTRDQEV